MEPTNNLPPCCQPVTKPENHKGIFWGIVYGILPHIFCIVFIILSVIGATAGAAFFGRFLAMPFFFPGLIALSFVFATISATLYLKRSQRLSFEGIENSKKYLGILYGTTLGIGLLIAYVVFPWIISATNSTPATQTQNEASLTIQVAIPCPGHAPLIIDALKKLNGVRDVQFTAPDIFKISYDQNNTTPQAITSLDIFKTYKATIK
jgi:hypothetical protein